MSTKLVLVSLLVALPFAAHAGIRANGKDLNGKDLNGKDLNGKDLNGKDLNGKDLNGVAIYGTQVTGYSSGYYKSGTGMVGARFDVTDPAGNVIGTLKINSAGTLTGNNYDVWTYDVSMEYWALGCAHYGYTEGVRLDKNCSNVEGAVIARDAYCGSTRWDSLCVTKFWEEYNKVAGNWWYYWHYHQEASACGQDGDQDGFWFSNRPSRRGLFLPGRWDGRQGVQGGGAKLADGKTFACLPSPDRRGGGAIAKCVTDGYKPWKTSALEYSHQACVRMYRADVCGDGASWTENGRGIDIYDNQSIQFSETTWSVEGEWLASGAQAVTVYNRFKSPTGETLLGYKSSHPYCKAIISTTTHPGWLGYFLSGRTDTVFTKFSPN